MQDELLDLVKAAKPITKRKRFLGVLLTVVCLLAGGEPGSCLANLVI